MSFTRRDPSLSMMSGSIVISGGTITQYNTSDGHKSSFEILKDNVSHAAFHNSAARFDPPKCHPNTRVSVLKKIMDWVRRTDWETWYRYIIWLTGAAGAGKSAIAQSIIELCLLENLVIASFFFFRSDASRNNGKPLIATLAYQIFSSVPATQPHILSAIENDHFIFTRSLEHQFDVLVIQPLRKFYEPLDTLDEKCRRVIVIDGLDECVDRNTQCKILNLFCDAIRNYELPIIFLIASRPEHDIKTTFNSKPMEGVFYRLYLDESFYPDNDIRTFLADSFENIKMNHPYKQQIPLLWPTAGAVESIVRKASGQFIYAATVVRFVKSIRHQPHHRLDVVQNLRPAGKESPFAELDALYSMILSAAEDIDQVLYALSIYTYHVFGDSNHDLCKFMALDPTELNILFCDLAALVSVECFPEHNIHRLHILHASLHDFLRDRKRSKEYHIPRERYRSQLLANVLRYARLTVGMGYHLVVVICFFFNNFEDCTSSPDLLREASLFPLAQVSNALKNYNYEEYDGIKFMFHDFFGFLRRMANRHSDWSLVEKNQQKALDGIFLSYMDHYYANDHRTALLCFACRAGSEDLVPGVCAGLGGSDWGEAMVSHCKFIGMVKHEDDPLGLQMDLSDFNGSTTIPYQQCVIRFLQDPDRSGKYVLGSIAYATASLCVIEQLQKLDWSNRAQCKEEPVFDECYMRRQTILMTNGRWKIILTEGSGTDRGMFDNTGTTSEQYFLYLGYLIFFLPRSGKSGSLSQHCRGETFLATPGTALYPERTALVREAMKDYVERVQDMEDGFLEGFYSK